MKRNVWMATVFACAATAVAAAQSGTTATGTAGDKMHPEKITVVGCLQPDTAASTTTSAGAYKLTNATMADARSSSSTSSTATGTTGTTGTATAGMGSSYVLDGRDTELKNHVGHKIEVTGTLESHKGMSSTSPSATSSGSASTHMNDGAQRLQVASVRMIASDCSAK